MTDLLKRLAAAPGVYRGRGDGLESGPFVARIKVTSVVRGNAITLDYEAVSDSKGLQHVEHTILTASEAGRLEHAVSEQVAERLYERMGRPATCPHGNPIPGTPVADGAQRPLGSLGPGERARVRRVSEVTEHEAPMLLRFLADHGFALGVPVRVVSTDPGAGALTVEVGGTRRVAMSLDMAQRVWVD